MVWEKQPFYIRHCQNNGQTVTKTNEDIAFWGKKWRTWLSLNVWKQRVSIKRVYLLLHCDRHISKLRSESACVCERCMRRQKSEQISEKKWNGMAKDHKTNKWKQKIKTNIEPSVQKRVCTNQAHFCTDRCFGDECSCLCTSIFQNIFRFIW